MAMLRPGDHGDLRFTTATALLDTGATVSGVGPKIVTALGLESYGKNRLGSATDEVFTDYYLFRLGLFSNEQLLLDQLGPGDLPFIFDELDGFSWRRQTDFDVIVGMDILSRCDVKLSRGGVRTIGFGSRSKPVQRRMVQEVACAPALCSPPLRFPSHSPPPPSRRPATSPPCSATFRRLPP